MYLLGDTHFNDHDAKFMDPNWITPEEQVRSINEVVRKTDTFICLRDVGEAEYGSQIEMSAGISPVSLGKLIKEGLVAGIPSIHRMMIDRAL